ncbi:phage antirepressor N-terminal domain-containing protein [Pendulispora brunnea]|uniref:Phage antirepressor N-terminal domain-containing protein n=1 Tax=Pendulispora brunnea TaxID=2905690 RepID=A0ABZ2KK21_9BACT
MDIVKFKFHGDELEGVREVSGVWFPLRPMCRALGLQPNPQSTKLKSQPWATAPLLRAVGEDGKKRQMLCLDRRTLLMWLATIDANRVAEAVRPKLIVYQLEISDVIERVFGGGTRSTPAPSPESSPATLAVAFSTALTEVLPALFEQLDRRIQAAIERMDQRIETALDARARSLTFTIGRQRARTQILSRLRLISERRAVACHESVRRHRGIVDAELRAHLEFFGSGPAWANLPESRLPKAIQELDRMAVESERLLCAVDRARATPQQPLFKH